MRGWWAVDLMVMIGFAIFGRRRRKKKKAKKGKGKERGRGIWIEEVSSWFFVFGQQESGSFLPANPIVDNR